MNLHNIHDDISKFEHTVKDDISHIEHDVEKEFATVIKPDFVKLKTSFNKWGKFYLISMSAMMGAVGLGDTLIGDFNHFVAEILPLTVASFLFGYILLKRGDAHVEHTSTEIHKSLSAELKIEMDKVNDKLEHIMQRLSADEKQIETNKENILKNKEDISKQNDENPEHH